MEKIMILELTYHRVFYIRNNDIRFYITIPKTVESTGIAIELKSKMGNFDIENNDNKEVIDNIRNTYSYIDSYNITLVLPILDKNSVNILEKIDNSNFLIVDNFISRIINDSYNILISENKKISSQIVVINNDRYKSFITWFVTKYKDRVINKNLLDLIQIFNVNAINYKRMETPFMNFVVGNYNTEIDAARIVKDADVPKMGLVKPKQLQPSSGFASYFVLILIAVIVILLVVVFAFVF